MRRPLLALLLPALLAAPAACRRGEQAAPAPSAAVQRYTVRGEVVRLPEPGRPAPELVIRHEAVPGFVDHGGQAVGMDAMVMPFALRPGVGAEGLAAGDPIRFTFAVDWAHGAFWIERLEKLPPGTPLEFGPRTPARGP